MEHSAATEHAQAIKKVWAIEDKHGYERTTLAELCEALTEDQVKAVKSALRVRKARVVKTRPAIVDQTTDDGYRMMVGKVQNANLYRGAVFAPDKGLMASLTFGTAKEATEYVVETIENIKYWNSAPLASKYELATA